MAMDDARAAGATAADALFVNATDISVSQRLGQPEEMERAESSGVGLRVFVDNTYAMTSLTDLSREAIKDGAERAVQMARASIADPFSRMATPEEWVQTIPALDLCEAEEPSLSWMQAQCEAAESVARDHPDITNSEGAECAASRTEVLLANSDGFLHSYRGSSVSLSACVLGGHGGEMERDYGFSTARFREDLKSAEAIGEEARERTRKKLHSRKPPTQHVPVIFEPRVAKSLLGSFAQAISGQAVARGTSFLKDQMGKQVFHPAITILDDPHIRRGLASRPFDAEGLANGALTLIEKGVLQHWLLDIRSAAQLGLASNARASRGLNSAPSPSSTNLYMQPGEASPEELIADVQSGFYVTNVFGMGVNLVTGDYSQGAGGFWIENGVLGYPVSEVTIAGHLLDMFQSITPANDLHMDYGTNAPTLRIEKMMVAGS